MEYLICEFRHNDSCEYSIPIGVFTQFDLACRYAKKLRDKWEVADDFIIWKVVKNEQVWFWVDAKISSDEYRIFNVDTGVVLTFTDATLPEHFNIE
jgi:hypothetical protein